MSNSETRLDQRTEAILRRLVRRDAGPALKKVISRTRAEDLAAAMSHLTWSEQRRLYRAIEDRDLAADVLANLPEDSVARVTREMTREVMADLLDRLEPDDATDVVGALSDELRVGVLAELDREDQEELAELLAWPPDSAGGIMSTDVFTMRRSGTCGAAIRAIQKSEEEMANVHYVYVVDDEDRLLGVVSLRTLVVHPPNTPLIAIMTSDPIAVHPTDDQEEVARFVARYDILAIPVVDDNLHVMGVVTIDDVVDVIREEAAEDMYKMAGLSEDTDVTGQAPLLTQFRRRAGWLTATILGGIGAEILIGAQADVLLQAAVLAGFIPVIMGMGGNVGIQSATVAVRGLATGAVQLGGAAKFIWREIRVGLLLGVLYGVVLGLYGWGTHPETPMVGVSVGLSVVSAIAAASLSGAGIPLILSRVQVDPAIATGPLVTTLVDLMGIAIYFAIARWLLGCEGAHPVTDDGVEAVVVGRQDLGESDRIVRLLTAQTGRVDVVARGARASKRRFGGALEPGTRLRARWRKGRGELSTLMAVDVMASPRRAREDYGRLVLLGYGCDVLLTLSEQGLEGVKGFGLLGAWLDLLEGEAAPDVASRVALEGKALTFAGLTPRLVGCAVCGRPLHGPLRFDLEAGGAVHADHGQGPEVRAEDLAVLEAVRRAPLADSPGIVVPGPARWLLTDFIEYHSRRPLRSRALLSTSESP